MTGSTMTAIAALAMMHLTLIFLMVAVGLVIGFHFVWLLAILPSWEWWFLYPFIAPLTSGLISWRLWQVAG